MSGVGVGVGVGMGSASGNAIPWLMRTLSPLLTLSQRRSPGFAAAGSGFAASGMTSHGPPAASPERNAVACVAVVAAFGLALSWIFAFVALTVRGSEAAQSAGFVVIFPLVFASSVFVPVATMPDWLQAVAEVSPVTLTTDTARTYALVGGVPDSLPEAAAWIIGLLAIFIPLCVWRYRRMS